MSARLRHLLLAFAVLAAGLRLEGAEEARAALDRAKRIQLLKSVVMLVAMDRRDGKLVPVGRGSGSIISGSGLILTNNHVVADPQSGAIHDVIAVGLTTAFDQTPRPTCLALGARAIRRPDLDLAVIKCEQEVDGKPLSRAIAWTSTPVGSSGGVVPGDELYVVGYPAIGGTTITFTAGKVAGFLDEEKVTRAWIKTDALISPGVSGGAAFDDEAKLVGVPTQLRWQQGGRTNIGMVRPIEKGKDLLALVASKDWKDLPRAAPTPQGGTPSGAFVQLGPVNVEGGLTSASVIATLRAGLPRVATCYKSALATTAGLTGYMDVRITITDAGRALASVERTTVSDRSLATCAATAVSGLTFPSAESATRANVLLIFVPGSTTPAPDPSPGKTGPDQPEGTPGPTPEPTPEPTPTPTPTPTPEPTPAPGGRASYVGGKIVDASTLQGIAGAAVLVLKPGVRVASVRRELLGQQVIATAVANSLGWFQSSRALPQGTSYGVIVGARGYKPLSVDNAIQMMLGTPPLLNLGLVKLQRQGY
jgi:S1-C subfamily serine protease